MTGGCKGRELLLPVMGETAPQLGRGREHRVGRGQREPPSDAAVGKRTVPAALVQLTARCFLDLSLDPDLSGALPPLNFTQYTSCCALNGIDFSCPLPPGAGSCRGGALLVRPPEGTAHVPLRPCFLFYRACATSSRGRWGCPLSTGLLSQ